MESRSLPNLRSIRNNVTVNSCPISTSCAGCSTKPSFISDTCTKPQEGQNWSKTGGFFFQNWNTWCLPSTQVSIISHPHFHTSLPCTGAPPLGRWTNTKIPKSSMRDTVAASKASEGKALNSETSAESSWKLTDQRQGQNLKEKKTRKICGQYFMLAKIVDTWDSKHLPFLQLPDVIKRQEECLHMPWKCMEKWTNKQFHITLHDNRSLGSSMVTSSFPSIFQVLSFIRP